MATATERVFPASPTTGRTPAALAAPWLFTGEDNLRLVIINSRSGVVVTLDGRRLGSNDLTPQPFVQTFTPTADRQPNTFDFGFGDGFLLNCSLIVSSGSPLVGQTYCMLQVIRGLSGSTLVLGCLLGGYVTAMQHIAYPGSPIESSTAGEPFVRTIVGTVPALGGELLETVPSGARWQLIRAYAEFVATGAGADRDPVLKLITGGNESGRLISSGVVANGVKRRFVWAPNLPRATQPLGEALNQAIPDPTLLVAGDTFGTQTLNIQAADRWDSLCYTVREWLEAA